jgi:tetratricopeptide (TPR) repeat protein
MTGLAAALALAGCATTGYGVARADGAVHGCFEAANGRIEAKPGLKLCDIAVADRRLTSAFHAASLVNRGIVHLQADALALALIDFDAAIAEAPDNADAYVNKGIALLQIGGRDAEAVAVLTDALDHGPKRPEIVYYHRAGAYEGLGRLRDAYNDYAEAAQLAPDWAEPANQLQRFKFVRRKTLAG